MLSKKALTSTLYDLMDLYRVIAPCQRDGELRFDRVSSPREIVLDYGNTAKSPKGVFFPQNEAMIKFGRQVDQFNQIKQVPLDRTPTVLLGVRPCDARSFLLLDAVFAQGRYLDPYYQARRQNTLIVTMACASPRQTCFCHAFGSGPYDREGSDIFLRDAGDAYLVEGVSQKGRDLIYQGYLGRASQAYLDKAVEIEAQANARLADIEPVAGIEKLLPGLFDSPIWQEISEKCIACGTCTYACPTCHCFNIEDRVLANSGERVRAWDSCMYQFFTQHASGHNPRPDQAARWRQRTMHKFEYLPRNVGLFGCVGCGRCVQSCPVRLDIRGVLRRVRAAAEAAATAGANVEE